MGLFRGGWRSRPQDAGGLTRAARQRRRLLEKAVLEGLTPEEESRLPAQLLEQVRREIRTKIQERLDSLERGEVVDGGEFLSRWRKDSRN